MRHGYLCMLAFTRVQEIVMAGLAMLVQWHSSAAYTMVTEKRSSGNTRHAWLLGGTRGPLHYYQGLLFRLAWS